MSVIQWQLNDEHETKALAHKLAKAIIGLNIIAGKIYLFGNLGAGKTTLSRYFLQGLGVEQVIKSPTYTLIEPYSVGVLNILHMDLYRLGSPIELYDLGILEEETSFWMIEWPEKGQGVLPVSDLDIHLERHGLILQIKIEPNTLCGLSIIDRVINLQD